MKYYIYCRKSTEDKGKQIQSIPDQIKILNKLAISRGLEVVEILEESKSAKAPGRSEFNRMIEGINTGKAQGIICWKLDRLARNPIDGGSITWMLQQGVIQEIITNERDYHPSDNVLMMSVEFGMANQFIKDLSKNTLRGLKSKCEKGWLPGVAPQGYLNDKYCDKGEKRILVDNERFPLVRQMWDLMLTGQHSIQDICDIANFDWGYRTPKKRNSGGTMIGKSTLYNILTNPFYYGEFEFDGELYPGKHTPMITRQEFRRVQQLFGERGRPRLSKKEFDFTGLIKCGECGCMITAEDKTKYIKSKDIVRGYTYYHCTKRKKDYKCSQKSLEKKGLEEQIVAFLDSFVIEDEFVDWIIEYLHEFASNDASDRLHITSHLETRLSESTKKLDNLIQLKISGDLITNEEFRTQKIQLTAEKQTVLAELEAVSNKQNNWVDSAERAVDFLRCVKDRFNNGSPQEKRFILSTLGSNLILKDGILSLEANGVYKPLQKGILDTKNSGLRLEPSKGQLETTKNAPQEVLRSKWLLVAYEVRTCFVV